MVSEGYIYVLVRIDGRHMYCQSASLDMSSESSGAQKVFLRE